MSELETQSRLARLEAQQDAHFDQMATKEWVRELVTPIKEAALKTELATTSLMEKFESLFAAHSKLLEERSEREKAEHNARMAAAADQTWHAVLTKKVGPAAFAVSAIIALIITMSSALSWWIVNHVLPNAHVLKP